MRHRMSLLGTSTAVLLALCMSWSGQTASAQTRLHSFILPIAMRQQAKQPSQEFQGTIEKAGTKYVLNDKASGAKYQLDSQDKAKEFLGKDVKVTGTLDPSTNTIEVSEIQEMK